MISLSINMDLGNKRSTCSASDFRPDRRPFLCGTEALLIFFFPPSYAARVMTFRWFCRHTREQNIRRWHVKHQNWEFPVCNFDADCTTIVSFAKNYTKV